jgi:hypothetical protein
MSPWVNPAITEPPKKAKSQIAWLRRVSARNRNSNATPRKINASSMAMIGGYSAGRMVA